MNVIITGTSRGIGLELCRQGLNTGHQILAVARNADSSKELINLKSEFGDNLNLLSVDLVDAKASEKIASAVSAWKSVDILVNNAGILTQGESTEDFLRSFHVNTIVPFQVTKSLIAKLSASREPKVLQVTSTMGSIADNGSGGYYAYRSSKAALNMINKSLSVDFPKICFAVVHPGWVKTDMGGAGASLSVSASAQGIWKVLNGLTLNSSGKFFDYRGRDLPW